MAGEMMADVELQYGYKLSSDANKVLPIGLSKGGLIGTFAAFVALLYVRMWSKKLSQSPTEETGLVGINRE